MTKRKKASDELQQERIPETYDPVPAEVEEAANEYLEAKRALAEWRETMNGRREHLIGMMIEHDIRELDIDDGEKKLILDERHHVLIKAKKKVEHSEGAEEAFA